MMIDDEKDQLLVQRINVFCVKHVNVKQRVP